MDQARAISSGWSIEGETARLAFVDAVTTHQSLVFSVAHHILHNATLAEETAQDVFFRLYQDYHRIKSSSHLIHWLRRTTTHRCLDILRHSERHSQITLDDIEIHLPSAQPDQDPILGQTLRRLVWGISADAVQRRTQRLVESVHVLCRHGIHRFPDGVHPGAIRHRFL